MGAAGRHRALTAMVVVAAAGAIAVGPAVGSAAPAIVWTVDNLSSIAGHAVTVVGAPRVVDTPMGRAVEFNGRSDGLFLDVNPLQGLEQFTIEVMFEPAADGAEEQRFVHVEETGSGNRALIELRRLPDTTWTLDTFLRHGRASLTLLDRTRTHPAARWHVASLLFDGKTMTHYVDGVREGSGAVAFRPLGNGRTSIGVRQNHVSWFKGRIATIRITPSALPAADLLRTEVANEAAVIPLWREGVPGRTPDGGEERLQEGRPRRFEEWLRSHGWLSPSAK